MSDNGPSPDIAAWEVNLLVVIFAAATFYLLFASAVVGVEEPDVCTTIESGTQLSPVSDVSDVPGYRVLVTAGNRTYAESGDPEEWQEGDMLYRVREEMFPFNETHYVAVPPAAMDWCAQRGDAER